MNSRQELVRDIATALVSYGYKVYVTQDWEYGFYTDGNKVVSFQGSWKYSLDFSGNYISEHCGTGWIISQDKSHISKDEAELYIKLTPPHWATQGEDVTPTTPDKYLQRYGVSSGFTQFEV